MTKVLFLINNLASGGAERVLVNLVNNIDKNKYQITLRVLTDYGDNRENLLPFVRYEYVFRKHHVGLNYLHLLPKRFVYNRVAHGNFDIVIVYLHGVLTKIVSYSPKTQKTIAYLHSNMEISPFMKSFRNKKQLIRCFESYDAIVSVSRNVLESFQKMTGINNKLHVIYNTFDVQEIVNGSKKAVPKGIFKENKINICSVGKLTSIKGYDRLLRVIKKLSDGNYKFRLLIIGDGPMREEMQNYIEINNLEEYVILIGYDKNPFKYISGSDLFVCSSYSEGFSSVVVESTILGTPVITTRCAGMSEILGENNEYGIIVENDENSLFEGLKDIISDTDKLAYYAKLAKQRSSFFSTIRTVREAEKLIDMVYSAR